MAEDALTATTDDGCGCCRPEAKTSDDVVQALLDRRAKVEERLAKLEPALAAR